MSLTFLKRVNKELENFVEQKGFDKYSAPKIIDYLSIDTEGSEYEILKKFNFDKYIFSVITCEHNFTENRKKIFNLLTSKGYKRIFKDISRFDDWYIYDK